MNIREDRNKEVSRPTQHTGGVCVGTVRSKSSRPHLDQGETEYELNSASLKPRPASEERGARGQGEREREKVSHTDSFTQ